MSEEFTTFIQWKGTDLCMDFRCPECGEHSHYDGMYAYHIRCGNCRVFFRMPTDVAVVKVTEQEARDGCYLDASEITEGEV